MYIGRYWGYLPRRSGASGMFVSNDIPNFGDITLFIYH